MTRFLVLEQKLTRNTFVMPTSFMETELSMWRPNCSTNFTLSMLSSVDPCFLWCTSCYPRRSRLLMRRCFVYSRMLRLHADCSCRQKLFKWTLRRLLETLQSPFSSVNGEVGSFIIRNVCGGEHSWRDFKLHILNNLM